MIQTLLRHFRKQPNQSKPTVHGDKSTKHEDKLVNSLPDISNHLHTREGYCRPDWSSISDVIEKNLAESEWHSAWEHVSRIWMNQIRKQLDGNYRIYETSNFIILSESPISEMKDICKSYEASRIQILKHLKGVAIDDGYGKHAVMMFSSLDDYYGYIAYFYPEGENPMTSGVCLGGDGYIHFAFPTIDTSTCRTVLVHELTHGSLAHLTIPTWLNEALAMRMEQVICDTEVFHFDREVYEKHIAHWNSQNIQQFWTGESWNTPGNSCELSYHLAQILWRKIERDSGAPHSKILQFALDAKMEDAGEAACLKNFNLSLGDLVIDFLGEGTWTPTPEQWPTACNSQLNGAPQLSTKI